MLEPWVNTGLSYPEQLVRMYKEVNSETGRKTGQCPSKNHECVKTSTQMTPSRSLQGYPHLKSQSRTPVANLAREAPRPGSCVPVCFSSPTTRYASEQIRRICVVAKKKVTHLVQGISLSRAAEMNGSKPEKVIAGVQTHTKHK